tara:strand:- start:3139 stop:3483 length:345 start_codon:yes stop_codon:yes gene_type:complete
MAYNPNSDPQGQSYWDWHPQHHGFRGFLESMWHDTIGALIHGAERLFTTHGGSAVLGPDAKQNIIPPPPPKLPSFTPQHGASMNTLAPQQGDIQNNFSTSNQYEARFGVSGQHF